MHITSDIKPITYLKSKAADLLNQINDTHRPVIITQNGEPRAVLQDPESYKITIMIKNFKCKQTQALYDGICG